MYRHILIPTDGSECAERAIAHASHIAHREGARVTAVTVVPPVRWGAVEGVILTPEADDTEAVNEAAAQVLVPVREAAAAAGLACETLLIERDQPADGILTAAAQTNCDLIVMASHGRRGVSALLLGSETQQVLTGSQVPVLVVR